MATYAAGGRNWVIPTIQGIIDRRVLVNFRIDPETLSAVLPAPFRPQVANGFGIAGICLIRLTQIRPKFLPAIFGISSETAAHRIAVEWTMGNNVHTGVFIPRRDTSSMINSFAGGRIFPGVHNRARFDIRESDDENHIDMRSIDNSARVVVDGHITTKLPNDSIFPTVAAVSQFFEAGSLGYSPGTSSNQFDGLELRTDDWHVEPLAVTHVESSFFDDRNVFPAGSVTFDNALLMRDIDHEWHSRESLICSGS